MDQNDIAFIKDALDLKEASIKRAMKSAKPAFAVVYEAELESLAKARLSLKETK